MMIKLFEFVIILEKIIANLIKEESLLKENSKNLWYHIDIINYDKIKKFNWKHSINLLNDCF